MATYLISNNYLNLNQSPSLSKWPGKVAQKTSSGSLSHHWFLVVTRTLLVGIFVLSGCTTEHSGSQGKQAETGKNDVSAKGIHKEVGEASWYGPGFHGKETANGETFDQTELTAAHPTLPMGTKAKVTNMENDKKVEVRINDRGPYAKNRAIDVSSAAANKLDMKEGGTTQVKIETKSTKKRGSNKLAARKHKTKKRHH